MSADKSSPSTKQFINEHIERGSSLSIEVTLAKQITFEQARRARERGFRLQLTYIAAEVDAGGPGN